MKNDAQMRKQEIYSSSYPLVITLSQSFLSLVYSRPRPVVLPLSATKHACVRFDRETTVYGWLHNCVSQPSHDLACVAHGISTHKCAFDWSYLGISIRKIVVANLWYHDSWTIWTLDTAEYFISSRFQGMQRIATQIIFYSLYYGKPSVEHTLSLRVAAPSPRQRKNGEGEGAATRGPTPPNFNELFL